MPTNPKLLIALCIATGAVQASGFGTGAWADDLFDSRASNVIVPGDASQHGLKPVEGQNRCAAYGAGFVPLQGTDTCVKLGGRVKVQIGVGLHSSNERTVFALPASSVTVVPPH